MLQNQGEELLVVLNEIQLSMVQLYYQKEWDMVTKFNVAHSHIWKQEEYEEVETKKEDQDQNDV
jgi:phosphoribosylanthranilate isomerase